MITAVSLADFARRLRHFMAGSLASHETTARLDNPEFDQLALELFGLQFESNPAFRRLCEARGVSPASISRWTDVPAVPASAFKELEMTSLPGAERTTVFHSSGTSGQKHSRHFHNSESLTLYEASLDPWFQKHLLPESGEATKDFPAAGAIDFFVLTPPAFESPHSSLVHMFATVTAKFGSAASMFCGRAGPDGAWSLDHARVDSFLARSLSLGRPVAIMGTAFSFVHLLDEMTRVGQFFELPHGSRVLETGGYKGRSREMTKSELHALITERLGVPPHHIVTEYGMSELSSQAYDLEISPSGPASSSRLFRFPPWARVQIVSPETSREVAEGEAGLLRIFDLANVWSVMAVQTEDLAIRREDGFELLGRAAISEPRGCSLMAVER